MSAHYVPPIKNLYEKSPDFKENRLMTPVDDPCWFSSQQLCHREKYQPISWYNSLLDGNPLLKSLQNSSFRSPVIKSWDWGLSPISAILWPKSYCSAVTFDIMIFISVTSLVYDLVYDFFRSNMTIYMYFLVDVVDWKFFYLVNFEFTFKRFHLLFLKLIINGIKINYSYRINLHLNCKFVNL